MYDFMLPVKRLRQRKATASGAPSVAKAVGLHVLAKAVAGLSSSSAASDSLAVVAQKVLAALSSVKPGGLFAEWSMPAIPALEELVLEEPTASCEAGDARKALASVGGAWLATPSTLVTWWSAKLSSTSLSSTPTPADAAAGSGGKMTFLVARVTLDWDCASDGKLAPRRFVVQTSLNGVDWQVVHAPASVSLKQDVHFDRPMEATHIRIIMKGYSDFSTMRRQGIASIRVYRAIVMAVPPILPGKTLHDLTHLLLDRPTPVEASLVNHLKLVRGSASLSQALAVVAKLLDAGNEKLSDQSLFGGMVQDFVTTVQGLATAEHEKSSAAGYNPVTTGPPASTTKTPGDLVTIPGACCWCSCRFVSTNCVRSLYLQRRLTRTGHACREARETSSTVKATWSLRQRRGVTLLYLWTNASRRVKLLGKSSWKRTRTLSARVSVLPPNRFETATTKSPVSCGCTVRTTGVCVCVVVFALRVVIIRRVVSYRGCCFSYRYSRGEAESSQSTKINKGDTVRCELDMDAGTLDVLINGVKGGSFSGLQVSACILPFRLSG